MEDTTPLELLKSRGMRMTRGRKALVGILLNHNLPLNVGEIITMLARDGVRMNKTSIYREVERLLEHNVVQEVDFGDGKKRYEVASRSHHHHVVCTTCGTVEDVILAEDMFREEQKIAQRTRFQIQKHSLEFFGLCPNCQ